MQQVQSGNEPSQHCLAYLCRQSLTNKNQNMSILRPPACHQLSVGWKVVRPAVGACSSCFEGAAISPATKRSACVSRSLHVFRLLAGQRQQTTVECNFITHFGKGTPLFEITSGARLNSCPWGKVSVYRVCTVWFHVVSTRTGAIFLL